MAANEKPTVEQLAAELAEMRKKLGLAEKERDAAREEAHAMAEASAFMGNGAEEVPTGRTRKMSVCVNPGEPDAKKHKFVEVDEPLFAYTIDLPLGAGTELITNGVPYYHGQTYEVDIHTLRDLKSRVARTWDHERAIHSEKESPYRKPTQIHLKSKAAISAGL